MAEKGWDAKGLIAPLWWDYDAGGTLPPSMGKTERRDALAKAIGTTGSALSSRNSGSRPLGRDLAERLAAETGVSLAELGAPEESATDRKSLPILRRLREAEDALEALGPELARLGDRVTALEQPAPPRKREAK